MRWNILLISLNIAQPLCSVESMEKNSQFRECTGVELLKANVRTVFDRKAEVDKVRGEQFWYLAIGEHGIV